MASLFDLLGVGSRSFNRAESLKNFREYKEVESLAQSQHGGNHFAPIESFATLSLRVEPANVRIEEEDGFSRVTVDSANFPCILQEVRAASLLCLPAALLRGTCHCKSHPSHVPSWVVEVFSCLRPCRVPPSGAAKSLRHPVVEVITQLGLDVRKAIISSDGSWFHDVFEVEEMGGGPVRDPRKLASISRMLNVNFGAEDELVPNSDETDDVHRVESTVFELAGLDRPGLLADVTQLLTTNGCNVRSAAVWTHASRVAFVLSVTSKGMPIQDDIKLQRLQQMLLVMMSSDGRGTVDIKKVRGEVHHDRRLHRLLLAEANWRYDAVAFGSSPPALSATTSMSDSAGSVHSDLAAAAAIAAADHDGVGDTFRSPKHSHPDVDITYCGRSGYWLVDIKAKDRAKLLFDIVCTLADSGYEVFHATIDISEGDAHQEFYIKPRNTVGGFNKRAAAKLRAMLEASVQRRFPKGLKVHVHSVDRFGCLAALTRVLHAADLSVTRAKVKTYAVNNSSGHTFYVMNADGSAPDRSVVEEACGAIGGRLVETGEEATSCSPVDGMAMSQHKFSFSILSRQWQTSWRGSPGESSASPEAQASGTLAA